MANEPPEIGFQSTVLYCGFIRLLVSPLKTETRLGIAFVTDRQVDSDFRRRVEHITDPRLGCLKTHKPSLIFAVRALCLSLRFMLAGPILFGSLSKFFYKRRFSVRGTRQFDDPSILSPSPANLSS